MDAETEIQVWHDKIEEAYAKIEGLEAVLRELVDIAGDPLVADDLQERVKGQEAHVRWLRGHVPNRDDLIALAEANLDRKRELRDSLQMVVGYARRML